MIAKGALSPNVRNNENDAPGFHVNTILKISHTCAIKYGTGTTVHAGPYNGTVPVIKYSKHPLVIKSANITAAIMTMYFQKVFFINVLSCFWKYSSGYT